MNGDVLAVMLFLYAPMAVALLMFAGLHQWLRHREWMLLLSKGMVDAADLPSRRGADPLGWAVVLFFAGVGIALGVWPLGMLDPRAPFGLTPWMMLGAIPVSISAGLLFANSLNGLRSRGGAR
jgi:hypothetical protein